MRKNEALHVHILILWWGWIQHKDEVEPNLGSNSSWILKGKLDTRLRVYKKTFQKVPKIRVALAFPAFPVCISKWQPGAMITPHHLQTAIK